MKFTAILLAILGLGISGAKPQGETEHPLTADSKVQEGVPKGELIKFTFDRSKIFPGTTREVTVYVPRQYDPATPACVYVNQDGVQWQAPTVFDNLIAQKDIPVLIGIFVTPGVVKPADPAKALPRFNRSYEYDGLGPAYAEFLLNELLPEVESRKTADGRVIRLSRSGNDRAIGGSSSGAICAFTAAWERPDAFTRVFSNVGTFVSLRGGDGYPGLVRKVEPKPLRIFQVDGSNDNNIYGGDWWMANQTLDRALTFAGYQHRSVWGDGGHNAKHGTAVFPEAMRFLWKDWPDRVRVGAGSPQLQEVLLPGEGWELVWEGGRATEGTATNAEGEVFFNDVPESKTYRIGLDGRVSEFLADSKRGDGQAFGPDGRLYVAAGGEQKILAYDERGSASEIAMGFRGNDLVVLHNGNVFITEPGWDRNKPSNVWLVTPGREARVVDTGLKFSNGICASPDQSLLYVADSRSRWIYSYVITPDGTLTHKQRYFHLHVPDAADDAGADGIRVDTAGRLYVATRMGIQVCDQAGRVNFIIPTPNGRVSNFTFGGAGMDTLFAACGDRIYKRKLKVKGAHGFSAPVKPAAPKL